MQFKVKRAAPVPRKVKAFITTDGRLYMNLSGAGSKVNCILGGRYIADGSVYANGTSTIEELQQWHPYAEAIYEGDTVEVTF